jgi:hypothetical protein
MISDIQMIFRLKIGRLFQGFYVLKDANISGSSFFTLILKKG